MITSMRVVCVLSEVISMCSTPTMYSGMVKTVHPPVYTCSSTILHVSQRSCPLLYITDDIELRLCTDFYLGFDDIPIELVELYVW